MMEDQTSQESKANNYCHKFNKMNRIWQCGLVKERKPPGVAAQGEGEGEYFSPIWGFHPHFDCLITHNQLELIFSLSFTLSKTYFSL